jgi:hypothetical protein
MARQLFDNKGEFFIKDDVKNKIEYVNQCFDGVRFICQQKGLDDLYYSYFCDKNNIPNFL